MVWGWVKVTRTRDLTYRDLESVDVRTYPFVHIHRLILHGLDVPARGVMPGPHSYGVFWSVHLAWRHGLGRHILLLRNVH